jgi:hypothetical protein
LLEVEDLVEFEVVGTTVVVTVTTTVAVVVAVVTDTL